MVKLYTTPTCAACVLAEKYFKEKGVEYEKINLLKDEELQRRVILEAGSMSVPIIEINGQYVSGFNEKEISRLLDK